MNKKIKFSVGLILSGITLFGGFWFATPVLASACDSRVVTASIYTNGTATEARFTYATDLNTVSSGEGTPTPWQTFYSDGDNTETIYDLSGNTRYFYRSEVTNDFGTAYGQIENFTTPACSQPVQSVTGTGFIWASLNPCPIPAGGNTCTTHLTWDTNAVLEAHVFVNGELFSNQTSCSGCSAPWIQSGNSYNFTLYDYSSGSRGKLLAQTQVTAQETATLPATCQDPNASNYFGTLPCTYSPQTCQDPSATNYGEIIPCRYPAPVQTCQDPSAINYGSVIPCRYAPQTCQDPSAINYGSVIPCRYSVPVQRCQDPSASNYRGTLPCTYPVQTCQDPSAINYGGTLPCAYPPQTCQDTSAINYGGIIPCRYPAPVQTCQDPSATNYGGTLPCRYPVQICQDPSAINYHGTLPCRYSNMGPNVTIDADDTNLDSGDSTRIRWNSDNADSCTASGGANGWARTRNTSGTFDTGDLTSNKTYRITCFNDQSGESDTDSVTVYVDDNNDDNINEPDVTTRNATNIKTGGAILNGRVDGNGSSARAWFEYGTNYYLGSSTSRNSYGSGSTNYSRSISGLYANTIYYFRAVAENSENTVYGNILSFNTGTGFVNVVNNQPTVNIYADSINIPFNGTTFLRWNTTNAISCFGNGGSVGWAGIKSIGPGSFYTGSLTTSRTYTITCNNNIGSATDSVTITVRPQTTTIKPALTSLVLITSSVDRNQPIVPTIDNTRPHPGDEINYTVSYQNIGTGAITNLSLRIDLPYEVDYMFSNPSNLNRSGNILIFKLGTLRANDQGAVTVRARVRENIPAGTNLNFPATLSYVDPSGQSQSVNANVFAQVWSEPTNVSENVSLGASVFGAGFLPVNLFGWLLLLVLMLILVLLAKYLFSSSQSFPFSKKTTTTTIQQ
ncbi:hypothetical protein A3B85_01860 [Candidatus Nomurabacteria bacterium RIFCSPHIGHO2_02_FULL_37_13]|uniref:DUF11 domain-containing protein n=1 Tax=Candidatus Nomurabacteria bacterium RIFCSPHIGHO2_02_FULL_37_13 TaxID=1801750 RepID=A0A1F6W4H9_9BACT|nr:MAG: hypothetical protein A2640_02555 [Candidatus Nomurabacteria bacterium RIFCSPHIGHO2_01_FULL_36_23]OGI76837.1 MAG: hypothetical protein A3B85_01860 [Candidatus Nomurabacteria bacterium RIFCSPHIGHO2_02_FULL_37_13]OGI87807.1 MAG: hypothetical protein A2906_02130 [Candidatus Nomurabacteria bacterium RIFCSPLOWO2_01_FULL_37_25]